MIYALIKFKLYILSVKKYVKKKNLGYQFFYYQFAGLGYRFVGYQFVSLSIIRPP